MSVAYIALGANLGDRLRTLRRAVERLADLGSVESTSSVYETDPVGFVEQPPYLNAVVRLQTELAPADLLKALLTVESGLGRVRSFRNAPRTLDLDLLLYDDIVIDSVDLTLPHPRLHERAFVLVPLSEIAASLVHPTMGALIGELLAGLGQVVGVDHWAPPPALTDGG